MFSTPTWILSNYQTFLKFPIKRVKNFNKFLVKFTEILFIIYSSFLQIFLDFQNFQFSEYFTNFFQNFNKYYLKLIFFLIFTVFSRQFLSHLSILFYQFFCEFLKLFFKDLLRVSIKLTVEICTNFYFGLLKNFFAEVFFKFILTLRLLFQKVISNFFCPNFILCF